MASMGQQSSPSTYLRPRSCASAPRCRCNRSCFRRPIHRDLTRQFYAVIVRVAAPVVVTVHVVRRTHADQAQLGQILLWLQHPALQPLDHAVRASIAGIDGSFVWRSQHPRLRCDGAFCVCPNPSGGRNAAVLQQHAVNVNAVALVCSTIVSVTTVLSFKPTPSTVTPAADVASPMVSVV